MFHCDVLLCNYLENVVWVLLHITHKCTHLMNRRWFGLQHKNSSRANYEKTWHGQISKNNFWMAGTVTITENCTIFRIWASVANWPNGVWVKPSWPKQERASCENIGLRSGGTTHGTFMLGLKPRHKKKKKKRTRNDPCSVLQFVKKVHCVEFWWQASEVLHRHESVICFLPIHFFSGRPVPSTTFHW